MDRYEPLWIWISKQEEKKLIISFETIKEILGFEIDHSFLTYKKNLLVFGYEVKKTSIKNQNIEVVSLKK